MILRRGAVILRDADAVGEKEPLRELVRLAGPIAVSMLSYSMMTLVDTIVVGRLGAASLAGVGLGGTVAFALVCFWFGLCAGPRRWWRKRSARGGATW